METPFLTSLGFSSAFVPLLSAVVAGVLALSFFADYFRRKRSEAASIAPNPSAAKPASAPKPSLAAARKPHARSHQSQAADKDQTKRHHTLDVNTLKGHGDSVTALCFSSDGRNLATVCADGVIRVFRLDDATSKSFKYSLLIVWEIIYSKDGSIKEVLKVMQLKGHKSAVTSLCFTSNSEQIITASKDGSIRITISPDGKIVAAICGSTLQWSCAETGKVLDVADKSNEGDITGIAWAPHLMPMGGRPVTILTTAGADKKVKLWASPELHPFVSSESR